MSDIWEKLLDLHEIEQFPSVASKFVRRDPQGSAYEETWERFSYGYRAALELLARKCLEHDADLGFCQLSFSILA